MLRDDRQLTLNDLRVAVLEAADRHERAAELMEDAELSSFLAGLASRRRSTAEALGEQLRRIDDLPRSPDDDLETVRDVISTVKAGLSMNKASTLLEECESAEANIEDALAAALPVDMRERAEALVRELREDVAATRARLQEWLSAAS